MSYTIASLQTRIQSLLQNRTVSSAMLVIYAQDSALELSENYKFPGLQTSGPVVQLTPLQAVYSPNFFLSTADQGLEINKVDSFFIYTNGYTALTSPTQQNTGFDLIFAIVNSNDR